MKRIAVKTLMVLAFALGVQTSVNAQLAQVAPKGTTTTLQAPSKQWDFFISHASEDKDAVVRELAKILTAKGFKVWYDEYELKVGDNIRRRIDNGLANSKYIVVVLSPSFISKRWTMYELNGITTRELYGQTLILPIWHNISLDDVMSFCPSMADKMSLTTNNVSVEQLANSIIERVNIDKAGH